MRPPAESSPRQRGFTLLEVMIAIALTALVGIGVAALVNQLVTVRERFAEPPPLATEIDFSRLLTRRLEALVQRPVHERGLVLFNLPLAYRADLSRLEWVSLGAAALPVGDFYTRLRRQRLQWDRDGATLTLDSSGLLDAAGEPEWQRVAALDDVTALTLEFFAAGRWLAAPPPNGIAQGVRVQWQRHGRPVTTTAILPELLP
ncbi:prepilin-type N-terminal cleavage/methylation domain-containing protein [Salinicola endophyticus]|uniref:Prepilin-type N-terminal cleavage/methylation domain-containing protein n=1 Tax=Salinicola endophyticus TaxID=1949083 RepID=A0ABY8FGG9_9GAMM|nr:MULTISPECIES: prepilin-type N-terminal cleavage/methylation domain-containing protein [Salinicola]WFF41914.1 prepilin-type N-terminal cleavage/methylation domain-containing protein [Salinicola endophyticus]